MATTMIAGAKSGRGSISISRVSGFALQAVKTAYQGTMPIKNSYFGEFILKNRMNCGESGDMGSDAA
jgi:hypothetical protein